MYHLRALSMSIGGVGGKGKGFLSTLGGGMKKLLASAQDVATGGSGSGNKSDNKEVFSEDYRQTNTPDSVIVLPVTQQLRLLHTVLRNKTVHGKKFSSCVNRLVSLLAAAALDRVCTSLYYTLRQVEQVVASRVPNEGVCSHKQ
jgi:hypothetical protein